MRYSIRNEHGHYVLYVNGRFYGSYDTVSEASSEIDALEEGGDTKTA